VRIQKPINTIGDIIIQKPRVKPLFVHRFNELRVSWKGIAVTSATIENNAQKGVKTIKARKLTHFSKLVVSLEGMAIDSDEEGGT